MKSQTSFPSPPFNCEVVVHGNGFLANVRTFDLSSSGCRPISPRALKPGDSIRLEIAPERGSGPLMVRLGVVQWIEGLTVEVKIVLMETDHRQKIDEVAWSSVRGEARIFHWLRKWLRRNDVHLIHLSYTPHLCEERAPQVAAA